MRVPSSNADADWYRAIAKALGFSPVASLQPQKLREQIEYVLENSGLCLVFDNAAWLIPQRYSKSTPASRLNWIQEAIISRRLPCAIVVTPESYNRALEKYLARTGHSMEELLGGVAYTAELPQKLEFSDALLIARHFFTDFSADALEAMTSAAFVTEEYFQGINRLGDRARYLIETKALDEASAVVRAIQDCGIMPANTVSEDEAFSPNTAPRMRARAGIGIPRRDPLETEKGHA